MPIGIVLVALVIGAAGGYMFRSRKLTVGTIDLTETRIEEIYLEVPYLKPQAVWIRFKEKSGQPPVAAAVVLTLPQAELLKSVMRDTELVPGAHAAVC